MTNSSPSRRKPRSPVRSQVGVDLGPVPVAAGHAGALHQDLTHAPVGEGVSGLGVPDAHARPGHDLARAGQIKARLGRLGLAPLPQRGGVEGADQGTGARRARRHQQRGLGHAISRPQRGPAQATGREGLVEAPQRASAHGLGGVVGHLPGRQVQALAMRWADLPQGHLVGEVGPARVGGAQGFDQAEPVIGAGDEVEGVHERGAEAGRQGLEQAVDEAVVVVMGHPHQRAAVRAQGPGRGDVPRVGHGVPVPHPHPAGGAGGARGVLEPGQVVGPGGRAPPAVGVAGQIVHGDPLELVLRIEGLQARAAGPITQHHLRASVLGGGREGHAAATADRQGHGHHARQQRAHQAHEHVFAEGEEQQGPVAGLRVLLQLDGHPQRGRVERSEGRRVVALTADEGVDRPVCVGLRPDLQEVQQRRGLYGHRASLGGAV